MNKLAAVARDVAAVAKARVVIRMTAKGVTIKHNTTSRIDLIVVLGPATIEGKRVPEALLLEIGIGRTHPYHRMHPRRRPMNRCGVTHTQLRKLREANGRCKVTPIRFNLAARRTAVGLSDEQYERLAPYLMSAIQSVTDSTIRRWKSGPTARVWTARSYFHRNSWKTGGGGVIRERDVGKVFRVATRDTHLLGDLLWCSLKHPVVEKSLRLRAGFLHIRLVVLKKRPPADFKRTVSYRTAQRFLTEEGKLTSWQQLAVLAAMRGWQQTQILQDLRDAIDASHLVEVGSLVERSIKRGEPSKRGATLHLRPLPPKAGSYSFEVFASFAPVRDERSTAPNSHRERSLNEAQYRYLKAAEAAQLAAVDEVPF